MNAKNRTAGETAKNRQTAMHIKDAQLNGAVECRGKIKVPVVDKDLPGMVRLLDITRIFPIDTGSHSKWVESDVFQRFIVKYMKKTGLRLEQIICNVPTMGNQSRPGKKLTGGLFAIPDIARRYLMRLQGNKGWDEIEDNIDINSPVPAPPTAAMLPQSSPEAPKAERDVQSIVDNDMRVTIAYLCEIHGAQKMLDAVEDLEFCYEAVVERLGETSSPVKELLEGLKSTFTIAAMSKRIKVA